MPEIDVHSSIANLALEQEVEASLRANELNPKLLYATPRQTALWRQVFLRHSPIHKNPEFARIYRDAFAQIFKTRAPGKILLVGLGCGTGLKEAELCARLKSDGREVSFSAIDVSRDLVVESAAKLSDVGATSDRHLVCDLAAVDFLKEWLNGLDGEGRRIFTFFGLIPNFTPLFVARFLKEILRPGDVALASVHLAPVSEGIDLDAAMRKVLPQYDNPETLAWLDAALDQWNLKQFMHEPMIRIGKTKTVPGYFGFASWNSSEIYQTWNPRSGVFTDTKFKLFQSLRYTPVLFEQLLRNEAGLKTKCLAMTACREEAIWLVQR
jgi:L-histidine N-alpha-methyltransferase